VGQFSVGGNTHRGTLCRKLKIVPLIWTAKIVNVPGRFIRLAAGMFCSCAVLFIALSMSQIGTQSGRSVVTKLQHLCATIGSGAQSAEGDFRKLIAGRVSTIALPT